MSGRSGVSIPSLCLWPRVLWRVPVLCAGLGFRSPPDDACPCGGAASGLPTPPCVQPVSWASVGLVVVAGGALLVYYSYEKKQRQTQCECMGTPLRFGSRSFVHAGSSHSPASCSLAFWLALAPLSPVPRAAATSKVESFGKPALGGPWSLVDSEGRPVTDADLRGRYLLMYFGFTYCPDICPNELVKMGKVVDGVAKAGGGRLPPLLPVFVSLDPHRDTVAQMRAYRKDFHPSMLALTGTPGQVGKAAKAFRVYFSDVDRDEDENDYIGACAPGP